MTPSPLQPPIGPQRSLGQRLRRAAAFGITGLFGLVALAALVVWLARPSASDLDLELAPGLTYHRRALETPRPNVVHAVRVDLRQPALALEVTPPSPKGGRDLTAATTSEFLEAQGLIAAINGGFFEPFHATWPWDFYPRSGDPVDVNGLAVHGGETYTWGSAKQPVLCAEADRRVRVRIGRCPDGTQEALAGSNVLVRDGQAWARRGEDVPAPRTAAGASDGGQVAWLVVVDGRQWGYSEGLTREEFGHVLAALGVDDALNLDGGGSTTLAVRGEGGDAEVWNAPIHTRVPMRERPVANHIGVRLRAE